MFSLLELLASAKKEKEIKWMQLGNKEVKLPLFTDDMTAKKLNGIIKNAIIILFFFQSNNWGSMGKTELQGKGGLIKFSNFIYL